MLTSIRASLILLAFVASSVNQITFAEDLAQKENTDNELQAPEPLQEVWSLFSEGKYEQVRDSLTLKESITNAHASLLWALIYDLGLGVEIERDRASFWYENAWRLGLDAGALALVEKTKSDTSNKAKLRLKTHALIKNAALAGKNCISIGVFKFGKEKSRAKNIAKALRFNRSRALAGSQPWAYANVAKLLEDPANTEIVNTYILSNTYRKKASELEAASALERQALNSRFGLGKEEDIEEAKQLYLKGSELGRLSSTISYAKLLIKSDDPDEISKGLGILEDSAIEDPSEMQDLAEIYHRGEKTEKDLKKAQKFYHLSAELGNAHAASELGRFLKQGWAGTTDATEAESYFRKAASRGSYWGATHYGNTMLEKATNPEDAKIGLFWLEQAALWGNNSAMKKLISLYLNGSELVPKDLAIAQYWVDWAVAHDDRSALWYYANQVFDEYKKSYGKNAKTTKLLWESSRKLLALGDHRAASVVSGLMLSKNSPYYNYDSAISLLEVYKESNANSLRQLFTQYAKKGGRLNNEESAWQLLEESTLEIDDLKLEFMLAHPERITDNFLGWLRESKANDRLSPELEPLAELESLDAIYAYFADKIVARSIETKIKGSRHSIGKRKLIRAPRLSLEGTFFYRYPIQLRADCILTIRSDGSVSNVEVNNWNHPLAKELFSRYGMKYLWQRSAKKNSKSVRASITLNLNNISS